MATGKSLTTCLGVEKYQNRSESIDALILAHLLLLIVAEEWLLKNRKFPNWTPMRYMPQYPGNETNNQLYRRN